MTMDDEKSKSKCIYLYAKPFGCGRAFLHLCERVQFWLLYVKEEMTQPGSQSSPEDQLS